MMEPSAGDATPTSRGPGRPKQLCAGQREALILDAMERVLLAHGLHGASMSAIAREAGMSKRTVYQVFANRAALFTACVRRIRLSFVRPLALGEADLPLRQRLSCMLTPDIRLAASTMPIAVLRAVVAEAPRYPDLAQAFLEEGPNAARRIVREELDRSVARGEIRVADTALAASILCDMAYESPVDRMVAPEAAARSTAAVQARVAGALDIFLSGVEPK